MNSLFSRKKTKKQKHHMLFKSLFYPASLKNLLSAKTEAINTNGSAVIPRGRAGVCLPGSSHFSIVKLIAVYRLRLPGHALPVDSLSDGVLVRGRVHLRGVVVTWGPVAPFAAVVAVTVIHCAVVIIKSCSQETTSRRMQ